MCELECHKPVAMGEKITYKGNKGTLNCVNESLFSRAEFPITAVPADPLSTVLMLNNTLVFMLLFSPTWVPLDRCSSQLIVIGSDCIG